MNNNAQEIYLDKYDGIIASVVISFLNSWVPECQKNQ